MAQDQKLEDVEKDFVRRYLFSKFEERSQIEEEYKRWKESLDKGAELCEKINNRLEKKSLRFRPGVERLYFDDIFSFQTINFPNKEDRNKYDVSIQIQPRENDNQIEGDVCPSLFGAKAIFSVGDYAKRAFDFDALGEGVIKGLESDVICSFLCLEPPTESEKGGINIENPSTTDRTEVVEQTICVVAPCCDPASEQIPSLAYKQIPIRTHRQAEELVAACRDQAQRFVGLAATCEDESLTWEFLYGEVLMRAEISAGLNNRCYVYLTTSSDSFKDRPCAFVLRDSIDPFTAILSEFTFEQDTQDKNTFIAENFVDIEFSNRIEFV